MNIQDLIDKYSGRYFLVFVIICIFKTLNFIDNETFKAIVIIYLTGGMISKISDKFGKLNE